MSLLTPRSANSFHPGDPANVFSSVAGDEALVCDGWRCTRVLQGPGECSDEETSPLPERWRFTTYRLSTDEAMYQAHICRLAMDAVRVPGQCEDRRVNLHRWYDGEADVHVEGFGADWCQLQVAVLLENLERYWGFKCGGDFVFQPVTFD